MPPDGSPADDERKCLRIIPLMDEHRSTLHIGCGNVRLEGWWNIDVSPSAAVDQVLDVRQGLPFRELRFIFSEHFLEHLEITDALQFLGRCRGALAPDGVLRITTPNLDWTMLTHYRFGRWLDDNESGAGFGEVRWTERGESESPDLRGLESHWPSPDRPELRHMLYCEASGVGPASDDRAWISDYLTNLAAQ